MAMGEGAAIVSTPNTRGDGTRSHEAPEGQDGSGEGARREERRQNTDDKGVVRPEREKVSLHDQAAFARRRALTEARSASA